MALENKKVECCRIHAPHGAMEMTGEAGWGAWGVGDPLP